MAQLRQRSALPLLIWWVGILPTCLGCLTVVTVFDIAERSRFALFEAFSTNLIMLLRQVGWWHWQKVYNQSLNKKGPVPSLVLRWTGPFLCCVLVNHFPYDVLAVTPCAALALVMPEHDATFKRAAVNLA